MSISPPLRVLLGLLLVLSGFSTSFIANALVIDNFGGATQTVRSEAEAPPSQTVAAQAAAMVLGGERDIVVTKTVGGDEDRANLRSNPTGQNLLRFSNDSGVRSIGQVIYDGMDDDAAIDYDGLGGGAGIDFRADGSGAFRLIVSASDLGGTARITVYDAADPAGGNFASIEFTVPGALTGAGVLLPTDPEVEIITFFNDFVASGGSSLGLIFSQVGAVVFEIDGSTPNQANWDVDFALIDTVPVPPALLLLLPALMVLVGQRRKAK